jgi:hypothetical protein
MGFRSIAPGAAQSGAATAGGGLREYTGPSAVRHAAGFPTSPTGPFCASHAVAKSTPRESLYDRPCVATLPRCSAAEGTPSPSTPHPQPRSASTVPFPRLCTTCAQRRGPAGQGGDVASCAGDCYARYRE